MTMHRNFMEERQDESEVASGMTFTIGDEAANVRDVSIQLTNGNGSPIAGKKLVKVVVFSTVGQTALATGGSTGLAAKAGTILVATHTAKLVFEFLSTATGLVEMTWTDTGTESVAVAAYCDGVSGLSAAFANT